MDYRYLFLIWITINCYQLLFGKYFIYYWEYIFTWKKHQNFMDCCSPNSFKFKSIWWVIEKIRSNQEVLWKRAFLDNSGKFPEKKSMAESAFSKASRKVTLWMFSGEFSGHFQNNYSKGILIQDGYLWSKYIFMLTEKIWSNMGGNFRLTWVFEQFS